MIIQNHDKVFGGAHTSIEETHRYCSQCGAKMRRAEEVLGYNRRTGQASTVENWQCSKLDLLPRGD